MAEPDLQVLARQTPAVPDMVLILAVAAKSVSSWHLHFTSLPLRLEPFRILLVYYIILFILAFYIPE